MVLETVHLIGIRRKWNDLVFDNGQTEQHLIDERNKQNFVVSTVGGKSVKEAPKMGMSWVVCVIYGLQNFSSLHVSNHLKEWSEVQTLTIDIEDWTQFCLSFKFLMNLYKIKI